jgi:hypothetical protein
MTGLPEIPLEQGTPLALARRFPRKARSLAQAAAGTFGHASRLLAAIAAPLTDRASARWLVRQNNPYWPEIAQMAALLGMPGVVSLNVCFEWGCTSGVWPSAEGPVLRRVMDWPFPALGENMVVLAQEGPAGGFSAITWPGIAGVFQGVAPGRFAAAINQAPMRRHGMGFVGDWLKGRHAVRHGHGLPPAHLLRNMFEHAADYAAAKKLLCQTEIAVPAIFILAGPEDGCIIERTETQAFVREMGTNGVAAANHFRTGLDAEGRGWRARPIDSLGRAARADALCAADFAEDFGWFVPPIANAHSRLAFTATAGGKLALMGTYDATPVTQKLTLPGRA